MCWKLRAVPSIVCARDDPPPMPHRNYIGGGSGYESTTHCHNSAVETWRHGGDQVVNQLNDVGQGVVCFSHFSPPYPSIPGIPQQM